MGRSRTPSEREQRNRRAAQIDRLLNIPTQQLRLREIQYRKENFKNPLLVEDLLERSVQVAAADPERGGQIVDLAKKIAELMLTNHGEAAGGMRHVFDLLALAHAFRGNVHRLARRFDKAEHYFTLAGEWLKERGSGEARIRVRFLSLHASYLTDSLRLREARALLEDGIALGMVAEEVRTAAVGRLLLQMEKVHWLSGEPESALQVLRQAMDLLRNANEVHLARVASHNLVDRLCDLDRIGEAQAAFCATEPLFSAQDDPIFPLRRTWVKGRIHQGMGRWIDAKRCFQAARDGFLERGNAYDALVVSLALAGVQIQHGTPECVSRLASEIQTLLEHEQLRKALHEEGRAVLREFLMAAVQRRATPVLLAEAIAAVTDRARPPQAHRR